MSIYYHHCYYVHTTDRGSKQEERDSNITRHLVCLAEPLPPRTEAKMDGLSLCSRGDNAEEEEGSGAILRCVCLIPPPGSIVGLSRVPLRTRSQPDNMGLVYTATSPTCSS